jgi:hypothetical protein
MAYLHIQDSPEVLERIRQAPLSLHYRTAMATRQYRAMLWNGGRRKSPCGDLDERRAREYAGSLATLCSDYLSGTLDGARGIPTREAHQSWGILLGCLDKLAWAMSSPSIESAMKGHSHNEI